MKKTPLFLLLCSVVLLNFAYAIDCSTIEDRLLKNSQERVERNNKYLLDEEGRKANISEKQELTKEYEELEKEKYLCKDELEAMQEAEDEAWYDGLKKEKEVSAAKNALGDKAAIFESLVPLFKQKDKKTQDNVKALLKTFSESKDTYTRNIGIYFGYLVE